MELLIRTKKDLDAIKKDQIAEEAKYKFKILMCAGAGCVSSNCFAVKQALENSLKVEWLDDKVKVVETGCVGTCNVGPTAIVLPEGVFYCKLKPQDMVRIVQEHLMKGKIVEDLCYFDSLSNKVQPYLKDIEFFKAQTKIVLRNCGKIGYADLAEYVANDGYYSLEKVLTGMSREAVVAEMKKSGLRGRGGGGFP
ncbi:MAG: NAD(P)H-dependent oxidoreductase subunit E, partial [Eubacteriales bacterium]